jgi:dephospho-CoA kinase
MKIIGLTGGIASGKSSVAKLLENLGAAVIDADQLSRDAVVPGMPAHAEIVENFGPGLLQRDGSINRNALGEIVFSDPEARRRLESIVHPAIRLLAEERLARLREKNVAVAVYMAPLLVEAGAIDRVDEVWVVYLDLPSQLKRLMERDKLTEEDAIRRIETQMSMEEKKGYGQVVIDNCGSWEETERQVRAAWGQLSTVRLHV